MRISFFNRRNTGMMKNAMELNKRDKLFKEHREILKTTASPDQFYSSLVIVTESVEAIQRIAGEIAPYVEVEAAVLYDQEITENKTAWAMAMMDRGFAQNKEAFLTEIRNHEKNLTEESRAHLDALLGTAAES